MKNKKYNVVNPDTNQIVTTIETGDRILRNKSINFLETTSELNAKEEFIKVFVKPMIKLSSTLSNVEAWILTYLLQYLDYTSGVLKHPNGFNLTLEDIMCETDLKHSHTYNIIKKLCDKGIIAKCKTEGNKYIVVNPYIFMKGRRVNNTLIDLFKETQWAHIFKTKGDYNEEF